MRSFPGSHYSLWHWDSHAVPRHDLGLVGKDLATLSVHTDLHPVHVIRTVGGVIAERLDAGEVLQPASRSVLEGLVNAEVVRVAVHVGNWLAEGDHLVP